MIAYQGEIIIDPDYPEDATLRRASRLGAIDFERMRIALGALWAKRLVAVSYEGADLVVRHGDEVIRRLIPDKTRYIQPLPKRRGLA
jgi:hypothetical protein